MRQNIIKENSNLFLGNADTNTEESSELKIWLKVESAFFEFKYTFFFNVSIYSNILFKNLT